MSADDILSRAQPKADARIAYGSDPNQFGELRLPSSQHSAVSTQQQRPAVSHQEQLPVAGSQLPEKQGQEQPSAVSHQPPASQKQEQNPTADQRTIKADRAGTKSAADRQEPKANSQEPSANSQKPKAPHPVVMNIHGGFWRAKYDLLHASHLCAALTRAGVATWNLEYRRVGNPGGAWPGTFEDITNGFRFLRQIAGRYHLDMQRVVVMGHSAGGHLAVALAGHQPAKPRDGEPRLRGVVSLAGVLDLKRAWELHLSNDAVVEFLGGTPAQMPDHYREADPLQLAVKTEQRLITGVDDDVVPPEISRTYAAAKQARGERVTLTELPKCGHYEVIDPESTVWTQVERAVVAMFNRG